MFTNKVSVTDPNRRVGPITERSNGYKYLQEKKIPNMFQGLMAALMVDKPDDPLVYLDNKLEEIKQRGVDNVNWETFVYEKHPNRDPVRLKLIGEEKSVKTDTKKGLEVPQHYSPDVFALTEPGDQD